MPSLPAADAARHFRGPLDFVFWYAKHHDVVHRHAWRSREPAVPMFCGLGDDVGSHLRGSHAERGHKKSLQAHTSCRLF
jgi:hypothetical protein